jgi:hypothetical protein
MRPNLLAVGLTAGFAAALLPACWDRPLTATEEWQSLTAAIQSYQAEALTSDIVEITTDFTLGQAVQDAAAELRDFLESQIDCSTVTLSQATLTIDFGDLDDACTWNGRTYAGVATVQLVSASSDGAEVHHTWAGITDGSLTVDGDATVTWDLSAFSRRVEHQLTWTNEDGDVLVGTGDRTQALLDPTVGIWGGISIDGQRAWTHNGQAWTLDIDGVLARAQDPVPYAGAYVLTTPSGKTATLTFERVDTDTIALTLSGGEEERVWHVTATGITEADEPAA